MPFSFLAPISQRQGRYFLRAKENVLTEIGVDEGAVIKDGARSVFDL